MTYSEYSRIMEITEAETDNAMIDIDFMWESARASHRLDVADLEYQFESADYDQDAMTQMYLEEAETFGAKIKAAWEKFCKWVKSIFDKLTGKKPDDAKLKAAEEKNPKGVKVPFDAKEASKQMDALAPLLTEGNMKRVLGDIDILARKGVKVNIDIKSNNKNHNYEHMTALSLLTKVGSAFLHAVGTPVVTVCAVSWLGKTLIKSIDLTGKISKLCDALSSKIDENANGLMKILRDLISGISSLNNGLDRLVNGPNAKKTKEQNEAKGDASVADLKSAANDYLSAAKDLASASALKQLKTSKAFEDARKKYLEMVTRCKNRGEFNAEKFSNLCKKIADRKGNNADEVEAGNEIKKLDAVKVEERVNPDDTVFSSIFESTFANANAPKFAPDTTSALLSTPDQNMNEIMALLDNF